MDEDTLLRSITHPGHLRAIREQGFLTVFMLKQTPVDSFTKCLEMEC